MRDLFHIGVVLRFTQNVEGKLSIKTWSSRNPYLAPSAYLNAFAMCAVSFWGFKPLCRRLSLYLQFHNANVPDSHTTVSHDETTSDGPLHPVTLFLLIVLIIYDCYKSVTDKSPNLGCCRKCLCTICICRIDVIPITTSFG